jgi:WD40 repeat protein
MVDYIKRITHVYELVFSNDGRYLAGTKNGVTLFRTSDYSEIVNFNKNVDVGDAVVFSHNSKLLATKCAFGRIRLYDIESLERLKTFNYDYEGDGSNIAFTSDDSFIIDGDWDGNLRLLNTKTLTKCIVKHYENCMIERIDYDPNSQRVLVLTHYTGGPNYIDETYRFVSIWRYSNQSLVWEFDTNRIYGCILSKPKYDFNMDRFYSLCQKSKYNWVMIVYDKYFEKCLYEISIGNISEHHGMINDTSINSFISVSFNSKTIFFSTENYNIIKTISMGGRVRLSPINNLISICSYKGDGYVFTLDQLLLN